MSVTDNEKNQWMFEGHTSTAAWNLRYAVEENDNRTKCIEWLDLAEEEIANARLVLDRAEEVFPPSDKDSAVPFVERFMMPKLLTKTLVEARQIMAALDVNRISVRNILTRGNHGIVLKQKYQNGRVTEKDRHLVIHVAFDRTQRGIYKNVDGIRTDGKIDMLDFPLRYLEDGQYRVGRKSGTFNESMRYLSNLDVIEHNTTDNEVALTKQVLTDMNDRITA